MKIFPNKETTKEAGQASKIHLTPVRIAIAFAVLIALATAIGASFAPKPTVQMDSVSAAVQKGVAAFRSGFFSEALADLKPPAKNGNAQAAYWLGVMYDEGRGVKKDASTAISWFSAAAEGGWPAAKFRLGEIYFNGTEELQDFKSARKWLKQSARDGSARAQLDLAQLYAKGWGGKRDPVLAYVWYEFSAKQGNFKAQRLRDGLLKVMQSGQITKAQNLTETMASELFGPITDRADAATAPGAEAAQ